MAAESLGTGYELSFAEVQRWSGTGSDSPHKVQSNRLSNTGGTVTFTSSYMGFTFCYKTSQPHIACWMAFAVLSSDSLIFVVRSRAERDVHLVA